jgi:hypothetical protein
MTETALDLRRGALFFTSVLNVHLLVVGRFEAGVINP